MASCIHHYKLGKALTFVGDRVLLKGYGGDRYDVPDIIIIITDSKSDDEVLKCAENLKSRYVKIIILAIGNYIYQPQLNQMASPPTERNIFLFRSFKEMSQNLGEITGTIKEACYSAPGWSFWSDWEECSASCGMGTRERKRRCHQVKQQIENFYEK